MNETMTLYKTGGLSLDSAFTRVTGRVCWNYFYDPQRLLNHRMTQIIRRTFRRNRSNKKTAESPKGIFHTTHQGVLGGTFTWS